MSTARATGPLQYRRGDPRGQVLVLFALVLVVLLLVSALAIDYGGWLVAKRNYQNVSDAASLAGAQQLTRGLTVGSSGAKNTLARQAAWASLASALGFTGVDPVFRSTQPSNLAYKENGYTVWVASPPSDANVACSVSNPLCLYSGKVYPGHMAGNGTVFVRIDHDANTYMSRIAGIGRNVSAWSTAGRFPANFAVVGLCDPLDSTTNCGPGDSNIKVDGTGTNLIVETGDLGTNRWTKSDGNTSGIALGADSNAYMQLYDTCWGSSSNQCQLFGYDSGSGINTSATRSAVPLGAPVQDPGYAAPTISSTTTPRQCTPAGGSVTLASAHVLESTPDPAEDMQLAAVVGPIPPGVPLVGAPKPTLSGFVRSQVGNTLLDGISVSATPDGGPNTTGAGSNSNGQYHFTVNGGATYTITATDPTGTYHQNTTTQAVAASDITAPTILLQKNPVITGTVTSGGSPVSGATITITGPGGPFTTTTNASGVYTQIITTFGTFGAYDVTASKSGYVSNTVNSGLLTLDTTTTVNISLTPAPGSLTGIITDGSTSANLPVPGVTVTLNTGETATTNAAGVYTIAGTNQGTKTVTLGGTAMVGYAYATPTSPATVNVNGAVTQNFVLWPKGCKDAGGARGDWSCAYPSTNNCPSTTGGDYPTCVFTQANAIKPGTYHDITIDGCAWIDPKGGVTGNAPNQLTGVVYITGTLHLQNASYLFGDGVTIVMGTGAQLDNKIGSGFVLNYGTTSTAYTTAHAFLDTTAPCFRTTGCTSLDQDYAYAAWTTAGAGHSPWGGNGTGTSYDTSTASGYVAKGTDLGITWFLYGTGSNVYSSRFKVSGNTFGFLFNGILYGPHDDIQIGGGGISQSAAGQIIGWTIEYHGGTQIKQNWYAYPTDGQPFLIEPILGE